VARRRGFVVGAGAGGAYRMQAERNADPRVRHVGANQRRRLAVRKQHMVAHLQRGGEVGNAGRVWCSAVR